MTLTALYPGSFDPFTNGHLGIVERALCVVDHLIIAIATNSRKQPMFKVEERMDMIQDIFHGNPKLSVCSFEGLTVNFAEKRGAKVIIRGLRAVADFEYELQMANTNRKQNPNIETLFMMTAEEYFFVSSQNVKEIARFGANIQGLVPPSIISRIQDKVKLLGQK